MIGYGVKGFSDTFGDSMRHMLGLLEARDEREKQRGHESARDERQRNVQLYDRDQTWGRQDKIREEDRADARFMAGQQAWNARVGEARKNAVQRERDKLLGEQKMEQVKYQQGSASARNRARIDAEDARLLGGKLDAAVPPGPVGGILGVGDEPQQSTGPSAGAPIADRMAAKLRRIEEGLTRVSPENQATARQMALEALKKTLSPRELELLPKAVGGGPRAGGRGPGLSVADRLELQDRHQARVWLQMKERDRNKYRQSNPEAAARLDAILAGQR